MKKLIGVLVSIAITAGAYAQTGSTNSKTSPQDIKNSQNQNVQNNQKELNKNQNQNLENNSQDLKNNRNQTVQYNSANKSHPDGLMMQNGKVMKVKNGKMTSLDKDMTLSNGTKIMRDGTCIKKDGVKTTLKEGQHVDMSGKMISMKTNIDVNMENSQNMQNNSKESKDYNRNMQNNSKELNKDYNQNMENNSGSMNNSHQNMQNNSTNKSHTDGVIMQNGKMMKVKNSQTSSLDNEMTLSNGTKIMSDGTCIKKDGTKMTMKEGQHMDMSGNMTSMKMNKDKNMYVVPDSTKKKNY